MKKRFGFLLLLCFIPVIFVLPTMAAEIEANGTCGDNLSWTWDTDYVLTISGTGTMHDYENADQVPWAEHVQLMKKIIIEDGVESIGKNAFCSYDVDDNEDIEDMAYKSLTSVDIADSVTIIGENAFHRCQALTSVTIPKNVTNIGSSAFQFCSNLIEVYFEGNAPQYNAQGFDANALFYGTHKDLKIYYYKGTTGWDTINNEKLVPLTSPSLQSDYTAALSVAPAAAAINEQILVTVTANKAFAASELSLSYDPNKITFNEEISTLNGATVTDSNGTINLVDYGDEQISYVFGFTAKTAGDTTIKLISASFSVSADAVTENLTDATVETDTVSVTINHPDQSVSIPQDILIGNATVAYSQNYTFYITGDGAYYDYTIHAKIGNADADVIDNKDGSYTVLNVTDALIITASRTPKSYTVDFQTSSDVSLPADTTISYGSDFTFVMPTQTHYATSIKTAYYETNKQSVPYSTDNGSVTIKGTDITDNLVIVIEQIRAEVTVSVDGNAASDAAGYASSAKIGEAYTLTVAQDSKYRYTVSASVDGQPVTLSADDNTYTISAEYITVNSNAVIFTVTKVLKTDHITVTEYLTLADKSKLWLIQIPGDQADGMVYSYDGTAMFWSDAYNAYCTLVEASSVPEISSEKFALTNGTVLSVDYSKDVNMSGKVDANDAQFAYNMYEAMYNGITETVTVEKYLRADVNGDKKVDTTDAAAIVNAILNNK